jgi:parallel beta-helix repeat protein
MTACPPGIRRALPLAAAAASVAGLVAASPATAVELQCGATITQDTALTADIIGCSGPAVVIGAPGIVLDMGGHTATGARGNRAHGILNVGHADVVVRNGTVRGFGLYGVRLAQADRNVVENMRLDRNLTGIGLVDSTDGVFRGSVVTDSGFVGVNLTGGDRNSVTGNRILRSRGQAVFVQHSVSEAGGAHLVSGNTIRGNGIWVSLGPIGTRIVRNTVQGSARDGISVFDASTALRGNVVRGNRAYGIFAPNGAVNGGGNRASANGLGGCIGVRCR